jgi:glycosyltransferase involved in cell wall biosynthesis
MAQYGGAGMKTLHLLKTSVGARWALLQLRELVQLGIECHVVVPCDGGIVPEYRRAGVHVHVLDLNAMPATPAFFRAAAALRRLVDRQTPDVVHSHFVATTLLMRAALRGTSLPRVFQVPGPLHLESRVFAALDVATASRHDVWVASCEWTRRRYIALGIDPARVFLAHYGSDLAALRPAQPGALRQELGLPAETQIVGMVAYCYRPKTYLGNRRGIKGHEDFIDAIGCLRAAGRDVVGVVAGGAWQGADSYFQSVQDYAAGHADADIVFLGTRRDITAVYADLAVAVHPSLSENLGGAAESMLLGRPTVTTNVGGFPDLVEEGVTGYMVPPRDPWALAGAIARMLDDPAAAFALAAAGQLRAERLLDVRVTAADVAAIYGRVINAGASASGIGLAQGARA